MSGYTNPYVLLQFPDLGDDVSVLMKNPQLLPPDALTPEDVAMDAEGKPVDNQAANQSGYKMIAGIIVAWKVYEAFTPGDALDIDPDADPATLFESLSAGAPVRIGKITPENVGRLPMVVLKRIMEEISRVVDPQ
ncbi:hypothetical protein ACFXGR_22750 [Streptomyces mirabilis]|uniref:hypothetical protein n=1 Tax=Streptomyces mirabilis TaxID=68239 RepID=UPI00369AE9F6